MENQIFTLQRNLHAMAYVPVLWNKDEMVPCTVVRVVEKEAFNKRASANAQKERSFLHGLTVVDPTACWGWEVNAQLENLFRREWHSPFKYQMQFYPELDYRANWGRELEVRHAVLAFDPISIDALQGNSPLLSYVGKHVAAPGFVREALRLIPLKDIWQTTESVGPKSVASSFVVGQDFPTFVSFTRKDGGVPVVVQELVSLCGLNLQDDLGRIPAHHCQKVLEQGGIQPGHFMKQVRPETAAAKTNKIDLRLG